MKAWAPHAICPNPREKSLYLIWKLHSSLKRDFSFALLVFVIYLHKCESEVASKFVPINKQGGLKC